MSTTQQGLLNRIERKHRNSALRAGMPLYYCDTPESLRAWRASASGASSLRMYRAANKPAAPVRIKPRASIKASQSLRDLINKLDDEGDRVAEAINRALHYKHCHARKLAGDYFSYREKAGMVSYLPAGRVCQYTDDNRWARDGRQEMKPAKWAKSILAGWQLAKLADHHFAEFAAKFSAVEASEKVEVVLYDDVGEVYDMRNCSEDVWGSCMQSDDGNNFIGGKLGDFYECYGAKCLAVVRADGRLMGRAIYWPKVHGAGLNGPALDRMYASPETAEIMKNWARENGCGWKKNSTGRGDCWVDKDGNYCGSGGWVESVKSVPSYGIMYPYMDSFRYADSDGDLHVNKDEDSTVYEYMSTGGGREECNPHEGQVQLHDGEWHDEDDAYMVDGEYYAGDDVVCCHRTGEYILRDGAYEVELSRNHTVYISPEYVTEL